MSAKTKVTKTKTALKQETYNLPVSDLQHDETCGYVELGATQLCLISAKLRDSLLKHVQV